MKLLSIFLNSRPVQQVHSVIKSALVPAKYVNQVINLVTTRHKISLKRKKIHGGGILGRVGKYTRPGTQEA